MWGRRCNQETLLTFRDPLHFLQQDSGGFWGPHNQLLLICPNLVRFLVFTIDIIPK